MTVILELVRKGQLKKIKATKAISIRHPRIRDQSNATKSIKTVANEAKDAGKATDSGTSSIKKKKGRTYKECITTLCPYRNKVPAGELNMLLIRLVL